MDKMGVLIQTMILATEDDVISELSTRYDEVEKRQFDVMSTCATIGVLELMDPRPIDNTSENYDYRRVYFDLHFKALSLELKKKTEKTKIIDYKRLKHESFPPDGMHNGTLDILEMYRKSEQSIKVISDCPTRTVKGKLRICTVTHSPSNIKCRRGSITGIITAS